MNIIAPGATHASIAVSDCSRNARYSAGDISPAAMANSRYRLCWMPATLPSIGTLQGGSVNIICAFSGKIAAMTCALRAFPAADHLIADHPTVGWPSDRQPVSRRNLDRFLRLRGGKKQRVDLRRAKPRQSKIKVERTKIGQLERQIFFVPSAHFG